MRKPKLILLAGLMLSSLAAGAVDLEKNFAQPPGSARPWVFWFWLNGNVTSNGLTADLEAMQRVGIGGVIIMDVDQGTPKGPIIFGSSEWVNLFKHMCGEAQRLGLEVNINNDAGWAGSGGPWITPELSMQKLVWSETLVRGGHALTAYCRSPKQFGAFIAISVCWRLPRPKGARPPCAIAPRESRPV